MTSEKIRVVIADDIPSISNRIKSILDKDGRFDILGVAKNGYEAVLLSTMYQPDILLLDIEMEDKDTGLKVAKELLTKFSHLKIIILTIHEQDQYLFSAFEFGVSDYLFKDASAKDIVKSLFDTYHNQNSINPRVANKLLQEFSRAKKSEQELMSNLEIFKSLTPAEIEILKLFSRNYDRKQICELRHIEISTLKTEINSILKKFNAKRISEVLPKIEDIKWFNL